jgi:hypothetical protein
MPPAASLSTSIANVVSGWLARTRRMNEVPSLLV